MSKLKLTELTTKCLMSDQWDDTKNIDEKLHDDENLEDINIHEGRKELDMVVWD